MAPGFFIVAAFGVEKPALNIFAGGTLMVAGRKLVDVSRTKRSPRAGTVFQGSTDI
ncbi:conserved domain protein [Parasutterella excrementihominis YIT 11859]|uniref:Conserved domain protein n=1 Tax=Parasutterella excrementihominis YIT 11859 TaxID=762966 RepID=F3QGU7_9BURK|nr:conserved domain protein [Parasutterella excrementihominis YIT 11859]